MTPELAEKVVAEATSWLRTPYHHHAAIKGVGVDCGFLLIEVYANAGVIERFDPGPYPRQFYLHRTEELYIGWLERFCDCVWRKSDGTPAPEPQIADVCAYRMGRTAAHGAIVVPGSCAIHACATVGSVQLTELNALATRLDSIWRPRG
jgi:cell wall-associated NlpC family hydrolase